MRPLLGAMDLLIERLGKRCRRRPIGKLPAAERGYGTTDHGGGEDPAGHVLACALAAQADAIVSGDRHLLALQPEWRGIAILTAAQAVERLERLGD